MTQRKRLGFLAATCKSESLWANTHTCVVQKCPFCCSFCFSRSQNLRTNSASVKLRAKTRLFWVSRDIFYQFISNTSVYSFSSFSIKANDNERRLLSCRVESGRRTTTHTGQFLTDSLYETIKLILQREVNIISSIAWDDVTDEELEWARSSRNLERLAASSQLVACTSQDINLVLREAAIRGDYILVELIIYRLEMEHFQVSPKEYALLVASVLVEGSIDKIGTVLSRLNNSKKWILKGDTIQVIVDICFDLIIKNKIEKILNFLECVYEAGGRANTQTWNRCIGAAARNGIEEAEKVYRQMLVVDPKAVSETTYNLLIIVAKYSNDWFQVARWLGAMRYHGFQPDVYTCNNLLDACIYLKEYSRSRQVLEMTKLFHIVPDICTFTQLLRLGGKSGSSSDAEVLHSEAIRKIWKTAIAYNLTPDLTFFNSLIDAFARVGDSNSAQESFDNLQKYSISPDIISYNSLLYAYARNGAIEACIKLMDRMDVERIPLDERTYCIGMLACRIARNPEMALKLYFAAYELGKAHGEALHHAAFTACGPKIEYSCRIWKAMSSVYTPGLASYKGFISSCGASGRIDIALKTVREMKQRGVHPTKAVFLSFLNASKKYRIRYRGSSVRYYNMLRQECGVIVLSHGR